MFRPRKWPEHVAGHPVVKLHQNTTVHLLVLLFYTATRKLLFEQDNDVLISSEEKNLLLCLEKH
jgi:hypothetical protein